MRKYIIALMMSAAVVAQAQDEVEAVEANAEAAVNEVKAAVKEAKKDPHAGHDHGPGGHDHKADVEEAAAAEAAPELSPEEFMNKVSYAIGMDFGSGMKAQNINIDADRFAKGVKDALSGAELELSREDARTVLMTFQQQLQAKMQAKAAVASADNKALGDAHLAKNKEKEGVVTTESGLQYEVITEGAGPKPAAESTVTVHYVGTLLDGTKFDSSRDRGEPTTFPLNRVIPGWTEGVQLMSPGATYKFTIPSALAYGDRGAPPTIGPGATLQFEVELISFE